MTFETSVPKRSSTLRWPSLIPPRRFSEDRPEFMDLPNPDPVVLRQDLRNLRVINRLFGGLRAEQMHVRRMIAGIEENRVVSVLDLATGSADHPLALVELARSMGRRIHITAVDCNPVTLSIARERTSRHPEISVEEGNLLDLPYPPKSFDIVLCSLAIHHFSQANAIQILKTMISLSRVAMIVNDLNRSWPGAWGAWIYTRLTTRNPMTLNDSYVSVLRAFTPSELLAIANQAAVPHVRIHKHPIFRLVLVGEH